MSCIWLSYHLTSSSLFAAAANCYSLFYQVIGFQDDPEQLWAEAEPEEQEIMLPVLTAVMIYVAAAPTVPCLYAIVCPFITIYLMLPPHNASMREGQYCC